MGAEILSGGKLTWSGLTKTLDNRGYLFNKYEKVYLVSRHRVLG